MNESSKRNVNNSNMFLNNTAHSSIMSRTSANTCTTASSSEGSNSSCCGSTSDDSVVIDCRGLLSSIAGSSNRRGRQGSSSSNSSNDDTVVRLLAQHNLPDTSTTEHDLAQQMSNLSVKERNDILEDIHGVASSSSHVNINEENLLQQMQFELKKLKPSVRSVYDQAVFMSPQNVLLNQGTRWLYLAFLRACTDYNEITSSALRKIPQAAATKMANYYKVKLKIFGLSNLCADITLPAQFNEEERDHMKNGGCQPVCKRDQSGRQVLFVSPMLYDWGRVDIMFKKLFYTIMTFIKTDINSSFQRQGLVTIFYFLGSDRCYPLQFAKIFSNGGPQLSEYLPFKNAAFHACYDQPEMKPFLYIIPKIIHAASRIRFQAHYGTNLECLYKLKTFGIPVESLPLENDGSTLSNGYYRNFIDQRFALEQQQQIEKSDAAEFPSEHDVLLGRGRPFQEHVGNRTLASTIESYKARHQSADKYGEKAAIADAILGLVHQRGGRFLKRDATRWIEVPEAVAQEKIAYGFRTITKRSRTNNKTTEGSSKAKKAKTVQGGSVPLHPQMQFLPFGSRNADTHIKGNSATIT